MEKKEIVIDGNNFSDLRGFAVEFGKKVFNENYWGADHPLEEMFNFDMLEDMLYGGGYGAPDEPFDIVWKNSKKSMEDLGSKETVKWLEARLPYHTVPSNRDSFKKRIDLAKNGKGETLFDTIVEIINGPPFIELRLE